MALTKLTTDLIDGSLGTEWQNTIRIANFTATAGEGYFIDTTSSEIIVTLPSNPAVGDEVSLIDYGSNAGSNNIRITSSNNIDGQGDDKTISYNKGSIVLVFSGNTKGWVIASAANESSQALGEPGFASAVEAYNAGNTTDGFYNIKLSGWPSAKSVYCDMTRDGGGWMLWGQKLTSTFTLDIRYTGSLSSFSEDPARGYKNEITDLTTEGFIDMWPYFNGTKQIRWYNNMSNVTQSSPGTFSTKVLIAQENGLSINNSSYWNWSYQESCISAANKRYDWTQVHTDSGFSNSHNSGGSICPEWGHEANLVSNWQGAAGCGACYFPRPVLFGNGTSSYYEYGNAYDQDYLEFGLTSVFTDVSISNHASNSNQLWVK